MSVSRGLPVLTLAALAMCGVAAAPDAHPAADGMLQFAVLPARSSVRFELQATGHVVHGASHQVGGSVSFDPENLSRKPQVSFQVQSATLDTGNQSRDKKMRETHLESARFPSIAFHSTRLEAIAPTLREGETQEIKVAGTLSLHGVDRPIEFPVRAVRKGAELQVTGQTTLKMSDYAIPLPGFLFLKVKDEVKVMFDVVAAPAAVAAK